MIALLFLIFSLFALYLNWSYVWIFYILLILTIFINIPLSLVKKNLKIILVFLLFSGLFYSFFFNKISNLELWGDEIGVINITSLPFVQIVNQVAQLHAAVPPLDYWNMWWWQKLMQFIPSVYQEFFFRLPYMFYHTLAAIIFSFSLTQTINRFNKKYCSKKLFLIIFFLTFFLNPLLFFYSLEIRFYSLAVLGATIVLNLVINKKLFNKQYLPLLLLFCLNSIFQYIIILPFFVLELIKNKDLKKNYIHLFSFLFLFLISWPKLFFPNSVGNQQSLSLIITAIKQFFNIQFNLWQQKSLTIFIIVFLLFNKKTRKSLLLSLCLILIYLLEISLLAYQKGYFDFHVRHFLFIIPFLLYLIFIPLKTFTQKKSLIFMLIISFILVIPWFSDIQKRLTNNNLFSKALIGNKKIFQLAKKKKLQIIVAPNINNNMDDNVFVFNLTSFKWYAQTYKEVNVFYPTDEESICKIFKQNFNTLIFSINGLLPCMDFIPNKQFLYESAVGLNEKIYL